MGNVDISIIVPVYNSAEYLPEMIKSVLNQEIEAVQYVFIDDGSIDNSYEILKKYAVDDDRFVVLHKENGGQSSARNMGMKYSTGEYILYVDSDDYLAPNSLKPMLLKAREENLDILRGQILVVENGKSFPDEEIDCPNIVETGKQKLLHRHISYSLCSHMYRHEFLKKYGIEFLEGVFHEDMDYIVRAYTFAERTMDMDIPFYYYVTRDKSTTHSLSLKRINDYYSVAREVSFFAQGLNDKDLYEGFFREYLAFMFSHTVNLCAVSGIPISELAKDGDKWNNILSFLKESNNLKYRLQGICLSLGMYRLYSVLYRIKNRGRDI